MSQPHLKIGSDTAQLVGTRCCFMAKRCNNSKCIDTKHQRALHVQALWSPPIFLISTPTLRCFQIVLFDQQIYRKYGQVSGESAYRSRAWRSSLSYPARLRSKQGRDYTQRLRRVSLAPGSLTYRCLATGERLKLPGWGCCLANPVIS